MSSCLFLPIGEEGLEVEGLSRCFAVLEELCSISTCGGCETEDGALFIREEGYSEQFVSCGVLDPVESTSN